MLVYLPDKKSGKGQWYEVDRKLLMYEDLEDNIDLYAEQVDMSEFYDDEFYFEE